MIRIIIVEIYFSDAFKSFNSFSEKVFSSSVNFFFIKTSTTGCLQWISRSKKWFLKFLREFVSQDPGKYHTNFQRFLHNTLCPGLIYSARDKNLGRRGSFLKSELFNPVIKKDPFLSDRTVKKPSLFPKSTPTHLQNFFSSILLHS